MRLLNATVSCSSFNVELSPLLQKRVCHGHILAGVIDNVVDDIIRDKTTPIGHYGLLGAGHCEAWDRSWWTLGLDCRTALIPVICTEGWFILEENLPSTTGLVTKECIRGFPMQEFCLSIFCTVSITLVGSDAVLYSYAPPFFAFCINHFCWLELYFDNAERYRHVPFLLITSSFPLQGFVLSISTSSPAFFSYLPPSPCPIFNTNSSLSSQQGRGGGGKAELPCFIWGRRKGMLLLFWQYFKRNRPPLFYLEKTGQHYSILTRMSDNEQGFGHLSQSLPIFVGICFSLPLPEVREVPIQ